MNNIHIAALFPTTAAANTARDNLVAAGIEPARILVLDRGHADENAPSHAPRNLWDSLKQFFMPDEDANHYAGAIVRGHPLLVADVMEAQRSVALATLEAAGPINVEAHDESWHGDINGNGAEEHDFAAARRDREAAGSEGIVGGGVIAGDYGAVGATNVRMNTDILRGRRLAGENVRVYAK